ncbi:MAG TPA: hypothetical protein VK464_20450 [Symbiobacteriaceae bacterium]|nr:hypothetical protein [Symbiobacteriaceae bacterium]
MGLEYYRIEEQLVAALPEIRPATERYWQEEGKPGEDCGPYIFFEGLFVHYVKVLLVMETSPGRDRLLTRAFQFVDKMLISDDGDVATLAYVGLLEWREPWFYVRAGTFMGLGARASLDRHDPPWRQHESSGASPTEQEKARMFDFYDLRSVILSELANEVVTLEAIPGVTHDRS